MLLICAPLSVRRQLGFVDLDAANRFCFCLFLQLLRIVCVFWSMPTTMRGQISGAAEGLKTKNYYTWNNDLLYYKDTKKLKGFCRHKSISVYSVIFVGSMFYEVFDYV